MLVDIETEKGKLVRDTNSMAILAVDKSILVKDEAHKRKLKNNKEIETKINNLQSEISSIKLTLDKVLEALNTRGS